VDKVRKIAIPKRMSRGKNKELGRGKMYKPTEKFWMRVLNLPPFEAEITSRFKTANRSTVTLTSLDNMITVTHHGNFSRYESPIRAVAIKALSAIGSRIMPN
jgi:hypothetical protein